MQESTQEAKLIWITPEPEKIIEYVARTCYKSEDLITETSHKKMIRALLKNKHGAMLEHAVACIEFVTDRGISHEIVRHRVASYAQESTRYVNYSKGKYGSQISVLMPPDFRGNKQAEAIWRKLMIADEKGYMQLLKLGFKPQMARAVLPTCLRTKIVMTANFREWLHVFHLRLDKKRAHPQIVELMDHAKWILKAHAPTVFRYVR